MKHISRTGMAVLLSMLLMVLLLLPSCSDSLSNVVEKKEDGKEDVRPDSATYTGEPRVIIEDVPEKPENRMKVDMLVMMYMDGDNNLHDNIWGDLIETVRGYSLLGKDDDVEIVILWDGWEKRSSVWKSNEWNNASRLFRVGKDFTLHDISRRISWLDNPSLSMSHTEVNMNERRTLENFLSWARDNYDASCRILQLSDHGVGPGEYGTGHKLERAICQDVGNPLSDYYLGSADIPKAIVNSGIGKIDLVIQDVCLGGTVEEVYEYLGVADYMLLSPNLTPGRGHDYVSVIGNLARRKSGGADGIDMKKYLSLVISEFADRYRIPDEAWESLRTQWMEKHGGERVSDRELSMLPLRINTPRKMSKYALNYASVGTMTAVDVREAARLKEAIGVLVSLIGEKADRRIVLENIQTGEAMSLSYFSALKFSLSFLDGYTTGDARTYDVGFLADEIGDIAMHGKWPELLKASDGIRTALDSLVVASWRDGYGGALYCSNINTAVPVNPVIRSSKGSYGLAIAGYEYIFNDLEFMTRKNHYSTSLKFSRDTGWVAFMKSVMDSESVV